MTDADIDLIRAAGKAAGLTLQLALGFTEGDRGLFTADGKEWNPLTNDGDAFRLAVALRLEVDIHHTGIAVRTANGVKILIDADEQPDPYAATRRAIVRAAAAMG